MNNMLILAGTFALAIGTSYVIAQTAPHPADTPPNQTPPPTDTPMQPRTNMPTTGPRTMPMSAPPDFATLDATGMGYLTQQQASADPWLQAHFAACDANHNGQVTRAEYAACAKTP
jgi:hypothetical protein